MGHLHARDLLHRDIKPPNIVYVRGAVKLVDLSLATRAGAAFQPGGTRTWCPPGGVVDPGGDLFSVGCLLYWLVTGLLPERRPELPEWKPDDPRFADLLRVMPIIDQACHSDPAQRYVSAQPLVEALRALPPGDGHAPRRSAAPRRSGRWAPVAATVALAAAGAAWFWPRSAPAPTKAASGVELEAKENNTASTYWIVEPRSLPLRAGNIIRVRATFNAACYPVVALISNGKVQVAYPPT